MAYSGQDLVKRINAIVDQRGIQRDPDLYAIVPSGTLSAWKNKGQQPRANTLCNVAEFLGVSLDYLLLGKEPNLKAVIPEKEANLLQSFRLLKPDDQEDILDFIKVKAKRGDDLSNTAIA